MANNHRLFYRFCIAILFILTLIALLPLVLIMMASVTDEDALLANGYAFIPAKFSMNAYLYLIKQHTTILRAYGISFAVTGIGTFLSVLFTTMIAYPMSSKKFKYRNVLTFFVFFTMLFNGGVVPSYLLWSSTLHIKDTLWALILPNYLVTAFNVILVKNYYSHNVPDALLESARIDGANEIVIFFKIMLPLAVPVVATIGLFTALVYWNDWINGLYYISNPNYYGIQNLLIRLMDNIQFLKSGAAGSSLGALSVKLPGTAVRMAMAVTGILPIVITYPFLQKYFIRGVVIGAVKG